MQPIMKNVNLRSALREVEEKKVENGLIDQVSRWLNEEESRDQEIWQALRKPENTGNALAPEFAAPNATFSLSSIQRVAIAYRLRFLDSHLFQGEIPQEAIAKIKAIENRSHTKLDEFYLLAPAKQFKLGDCNEDPLLFVPLSNGKFYLVHQWGSDLKWHRKWFNFPSQNWRTLALTLFVFTALLTLALPTGFFAGGEDAAYLSTGRLVFFFWINLLLAAILSYAGFAFNFTFSKHNWNSRFFNG